MRADPALLCHASRRLDLPILQGFTLWRCNRFRGCSWLCLQCCSACCRRCEPGAISTAGRAPFSRAVIARTTPICLATPPPGAADTITARPARSFRERTRRSSVSSQLHRRFRFSRFLRFLTWSRALRFWCGFARHLQSSPPRYRFASRTRQDSTLSTRLDHVPSGSWRVVHGEPRCPAPMLTARVRTF